MAGMALKPIYANGDFVIVPLVTYVQIRHSSGRILDTYKVDQIERAVADCDELAVNGLPYEEVA